MQIKTASYCAVVLLACLAPLEADQRAAAQPQADADAVARQEFAEGIERYATLRARLEEPLPAFESRRDSWSLFVTRRYLASSVRTARARAVIGDVFTPDVAALFRTVIERAVYEIDIEGLVDEELDDDAFLVDLIVNEPVPTWALQRLPATLVDRLPALPDAIYYARVGTSLILWDDHAEILIDALPEAF